MSAILRAQSMLCREYAKHLEIRTRIQRLDDFTHGMDDFVRSVKSANLPKGELIRYVATSRSLTLDHAEIVVASRWY